MEIIKILDALADDNSRLAKESILRSHVNNKNLKECVRLALHPLIQFYIRKIPSYVKNEAGYIRLNVALENLDELSSRAVTGHAAIKYLTRLLEGVNEADALVIERIIKKDLRCGVSTATVNKIWPNLVPEFPCMLASGFDQKLVDKINWPAIVQLKLDGMRCSVVVQNGAVTCYSRNGKIINLLTHFDKDFIDFTEKSYSTHIPVVFDGELLVVDEKEEVVNRQTGNGILNKAIKGTIKKEEVEKVRIVLFDVIPLTEFRKGVCEYDYTYRFNQLNSYWSAAPSEKIRIVYSWEAKNIEEVNTIYQNMLEAGQEGIILKDRHGIWEDKRVKTQIKFKAELDCDLLCVGWEEGTGKYKGKMGALLLESSDGVVKVNVGTGFSDNDRVSLKNNVVGKIVAVCYNSVIVDKKTGIKSLFLPRFIEVREDKDVADSSTTIK